MEIVHGCVLQQISRHPLQVLHHNKLLLSLIQQGKGTFCFGGLNPLLLAQLFEISFNIFIRIITLQASSNDVV